MRTAFVNSAVLLSAAIFLASNSVVCARGPAGGAARLATPSFGGGRGGSSGLSFGSGGISFGGGSRVTIGGGLGGISLGTGGRPAPSWNRHPSHPEIPNRPNNWGGGIQVIPNVQIVPPTRVQRPTTVYTPQPTWTTPERTSQIPLETLQSTPQVQPNELPVDPAPEPIVTDPAPNTNALVARQITEAEVVRAKEFFQQRLLDLTKVLEKRLPPAEFDPEQLTALMIGRAIPVAIQIQIMDALNRGDFDGARDIWVAVVPGVEIPFRPSRVRLLLIRIYVMIQQGYVEYPLIQELVHRLPPEAMRPSLCCGADDLLVQIEEVVRINQAIAGVSTETVTPSSKPESFSEPQSNATPFISTSTELQTGEFSGKPNGYGDLPPYGQPGQTVPIPTGPVNIVYHPKLPDRQVVVVNAQTVMIGTGGLGSFRMERGFVAEALGRRLGHTSPLHENQSKLVRSGVVVVNPTHARVRFVFGRHEVVLEPGFQQALVGEGEISFDRGGGKGAARYTLEPGSYEFTVNEKGWDIFSKTYKVTLSNEGNLEPFHYVVQGEGASLGPEQSATHESKYPILIRFDRGDGSATKQIRWEKSHDTVQVAVNPDDNLWDLFAASEAGPQEPSLQPTPEFVPAF